MILSIEKLKNNNNGTSLCGDVDWRPTNMEFKTDRTYGSLMVHYKRAVQKTGSFYVDFFMTPQKSYTIWGVNANKCKFDSKDSNF